jgi:hypothetical protein
VPEVHSFGRAHISWKGVFSYFLSPFHFHERVYIENDFPTLTTDQFPSTTRATFHRQSLKLMISERHYIRATQNTSHSCVNLTRFWYCAVQPTIRIQYKFKKCRRT